MEDADTRKDDARLFVKFFSKTVLDHRATEEAGRQVFKTREYVKIAIPGDKTMNFEGPVTRAHKQRFPHQYAAFRNQEAQVISGTPLFGWPLATERQVEELKFLNVVTVEQLAEMPDSGAGNMMGIQSLKQAAQKFITNAKESAPLVKLQKELESRDAQIAGLVESNKQLSERFEALLSKLDDDKGKRK